MHSKGKVNKKIVLFSIIILISFGLVYYSFFYYNNIKIAIVYSEPYTKTEVMVIAKLAEENINKYCSNIGTKNRFIIDIISLSYLNAYKQNETYKYICINYQYVVGPDYTLQYNYLSKINNGQVIFISPNSSSNIIENRNGYLFRLKCIDNHQGIVISKILEEMNISNVILLHPDGKWNMDVIDVIKTNYTYGKIIIDAVYNATSNDYHSFIKKIEQQIEPYNSNDFLNKTAVVQIGIFETADLLQQIKNESILRKMKWVGSEAIASKQTRSFFESLNCFENFTYLSPSISPYPSDQYATFEKEYIRQIGEKPDFIQCARYDACWLYALSIIHSDSLSPNAIKNSMLNTSKNYIGLTGYCTFDSNQDRLSGYYNIYQIDNKSHQFLNLYLQYNEFENKFK